MATASIAKSGCGAEGCRISRRHGKLDFDGCSCTRCALQHPTTTLAGDLAQQRSTFLSHVQRPIAQAPLLRAYSPRAKFRRSFPGSREKCSEKLARFFADFLGGREKTPTPKTRFSIWTLLRTPGRLTTRLLRVYFTTKMSIVRPLLVLSKDEVGP